MRPVPKPYFYFDFSNFYQAVFRWDVDKTYLDTHFESFRKLIRIPFESAQQKVSIPGAASLLRAIRHGPNGKINPILFITSSPKELARAIEGKMKLDGVQIDDIKYKDQLQNIRNRNFNKVVDHISHKLTRLLWGRYFFPVGTPEVLFGDDSEQDPWIYSLYADIVAGYISRSDLDRILVAWKTPKNERASLNALMEYIDEKPKGSFVRRVFIHLATNSDSDYYQRYTQRMIPFRHYGVAALALAMDGLLCGDRLNQFYTECPNLAPSVEDVEYLVQFAQTPEQINCLETASDKQGLRSHPYYRPQSNDNLPNGHSAINTYLQRFG